MTMLSAAALLNAWERGLSQNPVQRALTLLSLALPEAPFETLAEMSISRRDWHLLGLREQLFGPKFESLANCTQCGETLELTLDAATIREPGEPIADSAPIVANVNGSQVRCRLPNSRDLLAVSETTDSERARRELLARCLLDAAVNTSDDALEMISSQLLQADPQAEVQLDLVCPSCGNRWLSTLDIASYLWNEMDGWALRTLRQVHLLASAYGWHEQDILNMSARRRQIYLQWIEA